MNYQLTSLLLPVGVVSGPSAIDVFLLADAGNKPGNVIAGKGRGGLMAGKYSPPPRSVLPANT